MDSMYTKHIESVGYVLYYFMYKIYYVRRINHRQINNDYFNTQ